MQSMWNAPSDRDYYGSGQDPEPEPDPRCPVCECEEVHPRTGLLTCNCQEPDAMARSVPDTKPPGRHGNDYTDEETDAA